MATETDAARDGVLAARAELDEEFEALEASVRAAVDIPAKIRRAPPRRPPSRAGPASLCSRGRSARSRHRAAVRVRRKPLPTGCSPKRSRRRCSSLGSDGDKVRGALERDFAPKRRRPQKDRTRLSAPPSGRLSAVAAAPRRAADASSGPTPRAPHAPPGGDRRRAERGPPAAGSGADPATRGVGSRPAGRLRPGRAAADADPGGAAGHGRATKRVGARRGRRPHLPRGATTRSRASGGMADAPALGAGAA